MRPEEVAPENYKNLHNKDIYYLEALFEYLENPIV